MKGKKKNGGVGKRKREKNKKKKSKIKKKKKFFFFFFFPGVFVTFSWPNPVKVTEWIAGPMGEMEDLMKKDVILVCLISFCMPLCPSSCTAMTAYIFIFQSLTLPFSLRNHNSLHKKFCT